MSWTQRLCVLHRHSLKHNNSLHYTSEEYRGEQQGEQHEVLVQVYVNARHFYGNRVAIINYIDLVHSIYCEMVAVSLAICKQFHPQESHLKVPSFVMT